MFEKKKYNVIHCVSDFLSSYFNQNSSGAGVGSGGGVTLGTTPMFLSCHLLPNCSQDFLSGGQLCHLNFNAVCIGTTFISQSTKTVWKSMLFFFYICPSQQTAGI